MKRFVFALLVASTSAYGSVVGVTDPTTIPITKADVINWGQQLGGDQSSFSQTFFLDSNTYGQFMGRLAGGSGTVLVAGTDAAAGNGISAGDDLLATSGNAPVTFYLPSVYGVGAFIQGAGASQFTARIQAFAGVNTVLDTTLTSDAAGDPLFLGVSDSSAQITKVVYSLTSVAAGLSTGSFTMDSLLIENQAILTGPPPPVTPLPLPIPVNSPQSLDPTPEPGTVSLLAGGLLILGVALKKRRV